MGFKPSITFYDTSADTPGHGKRFIVRAHEMLTVFVEVESTVLGLCLRALIKLNCQIYVVGARADESGSQVKRRHE